MKKNPIKMIKQAHQDGEPTFTLRAKDKFSLAIIDNYIYLLETYSSEPNEEHIQGVKEIRQEFIAWREANEDKVKMPD